MFYIEKDGIRFYLEGGPGNYKWASPCGLSMLISSNIWVKDDSKHYSDKRPVETARNFGWDVHEEGEEWDDH